MGQDAPQPTLETEEQASCPPQRGSSATEPRAESSQGQGHTHSTFKGNSSRVLGFHTQLASTPLLGACCGLEHAPPDTRLLVGSGQRLP